MTTIFTIENETGNITAFATAEAAAAASTTPFDLFTDQKELAELIAAEPEPAKSDAAPARTQAAQKAKAGKQAAKGASAKGKAGTATSAKKSAPAAKAAPKGKKAGKAESDGPREGSKMAEVIEMLRRAKGASISEIMDRMQWQRHQCAGSWPAR